MAQFEKYSQYYDAFYRGKDYRGEACYLIDILKQHKADAKCLLDIGCGTGQHASVFAEQGFNVVGIDVSHTMLKKAEERLRCMQKDLQERLSFSQGDARSVRLERNFDAVVSLFHVMSYMSDQDALKQAFETAAAHLAPGGVFLFDCWYGPGVLTDLPEKRVRVFEDNGIRITRNATPEILPNENIVKVHYDLQVEDPPGVVQEEIIETHTMRYLFLPEIQYLLQESGFELANAYEYLTTSPPQLSTWYTLISARRA